MVLFVHGLMQGINDVYFMNGNRLLNNICLQSENTSPYCKGYLHEKYNVCDFLNYIRFNLSIDSIHLQDLLLLLTKNATLRSGHRISIEIESSDPLSQKRVI